MGTPPSRLPKVKTFEEEQKLAPGATADERGRASFSNRRKRREASSNPAPSTSPRGSRGRMLATEGEHGSGAGVREERALRSEASLASCLSALPAPVLSLPRNDKLASLTGPNKGKTHITHGTAWRGRGDGWFSSGWCGQWRRMNMKGRTRGRGQPRPRRENSDRAMASCTQSRRVPRRETPRPPPRL